MKIGKLVVTMHDFMCEKTLLITAFALWVFTRIKMVFISGFILFVVKG